jgi:DNA-binding response OmpR family regulator
MVTARTAVEERIKGYASGADLYLSKPVSPAELSAAVGSVARRVRDAANQHTKLMLDTVRLVLHSNQVEVALAKADAVLLKSLIEAPGRKLAYWRLMELLELEPDDKGKSTLEVRISRLKKKLARVGASDPAIKSLWKEGYQLCAAVRIDA